MILWDVQPGGHHRHRRHRDFHKTHRQRRGAHVVSVGVTNIEVEMQVRVCLVFSGCIILRYSLFECTNTRIIDVVVAVQIVSVLSYDAIERRTRAFSVRLFLQSSTVVPTLLDFLQESLEVPNMFS